MPRIQAENVVAHRQLVRGRILDAFGEVMHERGFTALTLSVVAERAGVGRSTIYNYATDKNDLLLDFVERSVDQFLERIRGELDSLPDADARLRHLVATQVRAFGAEPGAGSAVGILEGGSLPPEVFSMLMGRLSRLHGLIREVVQSGVESGEFRAVPDIDLVVELIGGAVGSQRMPVGNGERTVKEAADAVVTFVESALRK